MKATTYELVRAALAMDETLSPGDRQAILDRCREPAVASQGSQDARVFLTADEVAKELKISRRTVRRHISSGRLKSVKAGAVRRIRLSDLKDFLRAVVTWAMNLAA